MDPVTHVATSTLFGLWLKRKLPESREVIPAAVIAGLVPDVDFVLMYRSLADYIKLHRGMTHSIFFIVPFSLAGAALYRAFRKSSRFLDCFLVWLGCWSLHVFLDLTNNYGTKVLYPLSDQSFYLDSMFIIDLIYILPVIAICFLVLRQKERWKLLLTAGMIWMMVYPAGNFVIRKALEYRIIQAAPSPDRIRSVHVIPDVFTPFVWKVILETESDYVFTGFTALPLDFVREKENFRKAEPGLFGQLGKRSVLLDAIAKFVRYPIVKKTTLNDGFQLQIGDLRFYTVFHTFLRKGGMAPYSLLIDFDREGKMVSYRLLSAAQSLTRRNNDKNP